MKQNEHFEPDEFVDGAETAFLIFMETLYFGENKVRRHHRHHCRRSHWHLPSPGCVPKLPPTPPVATAWPPCCPARVIKLLGVAECWLDGGATSQKDVLSMASGKNVQIMIDGVEEFEARPLSPVSPVTSSFVPSAPLSSISPRCFRTLSDRRREATRS